MSSVKYSAIAQNTYKFVNEVTVGNIGDVLDPKSPRIGLIKVIANNNTSTAEVKYCLLRPSRDISSSVEEISYGVGQYIYAGSSTVYEGMGMLLANSNSPCRYIYPSLSSIYKCDVDGETYYGIKDCPYVVYIVKFGYLSSKAYLNQTYYTTVVPACKINLVKYDATTKTIMAQQHSMDEFTDPTGTITSTQSGYYSYGRVIRLDIPKAEEDLILALTFEYDKYDLSISGLGLKYSLDDGVTYNDLTEGMVFEQVEHVMFKNADTTQHTITQEDGTVTTLNSGAIFVFAPTSNQTLTIA